ncbi:MAG: glycosyltransferase [Rhodocyclaceae bacterium]|nr:MAG: glycosyltransferase [Rhodocyclaceae bacterium]TNC98503.1 MAG: glycosyltransferase [Rhodocyclaceae bacterium]
MTLSDAASMENPESMGRLARKIAWLLRSDVRGEAPASSLVTTEFLAWWAIDGRREYPGFPLLGEAEKYVLFTPLPDQPACGRFGLNPLLKSILHRRKDVAAAIDASTEAGLWRAIAWLFSYGLKEHHLFDAVDERTLAALDETPPFLLPEGEVSQGPELTWLMFFVWRASGLEGQFDLGDKAVRGRYLVWFLTVALADFQCGPLLAPRWRRWLLQKLELPGLAGTALPRLALMHWRSRQDLQRAFDLRTPQGRQGLIQWFDGPGREEPALRWLNGPESRAGATPAPSGPASTAPLRPFGLNLIGFAFGELGIGEDVRMAAAACEAAGIPHTVVNISPGKNLRQKDLALTGKVNPAASLDEQAPYAVNVFCLTGFDTARAFIEKGEALFGGRHNIGWWPWELPVWPHEWQLAFDLVDEVWAATKFTEAVYRKGTNKPVNLMPLPASVSRVKPMSRRELGLPEGVFLFLYVFDFNSYLDRKNPWAAVDAFLNAFPKQDLSVRLVLKTMNSRPDEPRWLDFQRLCRKDKRIVLLERTMDRGEVLGLIQACDACVSLHRSEGFGRTLAEAMLFGKAVVATDFSGNVDFLTAQTGFPVKWQRRAVKPGEYPFVTEADGAWWAEPDIADAARQLRAAKEATKDKVFAARIADFAEQQFSPQRIGKRMRERVDAVYRQMTLDEKERA